jgi:hypothetical protein
MMTFRVALCLLLMPSMAAGATYYVDNRAGSDANDGATKNTPLATIARAVSLCETSDTIVLANTGIAYHEPIRLGRLGGTPQKPLVVEGNGAVLSGLTPIEPKRCKEVGDGVYLFPVEKRPYGYPFLVNRGKRLVSANTLEALGPEEFYWDQEHGIYFRPAPDTPLASYDLSATLTVSGFSTAGASYVICRDLVCEHFSNDGFNMHGDCRGIYLENVVARHNGDDGISIHEAGGLVVRGAHVHHNTYGIQDVNASRSFYNGVLAEHNRVGASFCGGFHSMVDCIVTTSEADSVDLAVSMPKHLIGSDYNPICRTTLFAKNVILRGNGNRAGIRVRERASAVVEHSVVTGSEVGVAVHKGGVCHLTASVVADCQRAVDSESTEVFRDYNVYYPGRMRWLGTDYAPEQWDTFRAQARHDEHSRVGPVIVAEDGTLSFPPESPAREIEKRVGPTQPVRFRPDQ